MMDESENLDDMTDKIKLFNSDESLKLLGELLSNKSSRDIIRLLIEKEMYKNAIATKLNLRMNLVSHHLEKMETIGLVETIYKKIVRKGKEHKFFRINPKIFLMPNHSEKEIKEKGILVRIFREGIKFTSIGIATVVTWIGSQQKTMFIPDPTNVEQNYGGIQVDPSLPILVDEPFSLVQITVTSIVLAVGLFLIWYIKKEKKEE